MIILEDILSQEIVQRLGWTLIHFIWQATAVALILAILLRILRKSTANLRYIFACLALALIVLLPVITIKLVPVLAIRGTAFQAVNTGRMPVPPPAVEMPAPETTVIAKQFEPESVTVVPAIPFKQRAVDTLEPALPYIVSGWLIGVFGLSIWNLGGWTQLQRLKRRMVKQVDSTLLKKLKVLTQKLKVKQTIRLMESTLVQIPTVVGWLRPVILLPVSALTGLSSEQLEAIIAHELAHIKRFDYLVNILQTVVETLGFYHPAVWWVSYKIRAERENCCDDMAVSISGDRVSYAGALASMEEIRAARGKLAVAASGGNLFRRICRLLGKDSTDNSGLSWVPAATVILLIIALVIPTTLALTNKSDSMLTEPQAEMQVDDDIQIATAQAEESPAGNIPLVPVATTSAPPHKDKAHVRIECFGVKAPLDSKIDKQTLKDVENLLGNKVSLRGSKVDVILRQVAQATAVAKDESDRNKRVTGQQFNALVKMLDSKGYIKILMNPTIETLSGKTATILSTQQVPLQQIIKASPGGSDQLNQVSTEKKYVDVVDSLEITPKVFEDGHIILDVKADFGSPKLSTFEVQPMPISTRKLSTQARTKPGESVIIGGLVGNPPVPGDNIKNTVQQANEVLFIITPTIMIPPANSKEITDTQIERFKRALSVQNLKKLGLAVAMYAEDHDENLPESIQELKPYIQNEQDFDWLRDNVEYFDKGKSAQRNAHFIPIAYDSTLPEKADGTNVLFLDFSVRFVDTKEFEKLNLKRTEFIIDAKFLSVSEGFLKNINLEQDSKGIAQSDLTLTPETLKSLDFSKRQSLILNDLDVSLLLNAARANKDSKVLAAPNVICREGKPAKIFVGKKIPILTGYTEPNKPSEKPEPKFDQVEKGISLTLTPNPTPNNNINMEFELEIITVTGFEEKMYKGKYPYKLPLRQSIEQATQYTAKNGQTLLFGGHKIADRQDDPSEQKDLLVLITARTVGPYEQAKPAQAKRPAAVEPPSSTTKVITPPTIAKSRAERQKENEQKPLQVQAKEDFELPEITKRIESGKKLSNLGKALLIYANDHDDKYPDSLRQLSDYFKKVEDFHWVLENVAYLASGKTLAVRPDTVIAYDKKLLIKEKGTNVLYNDCHVGFEKTEELKKLGINIIGTEFLIEARFLAVTEDFIQNINHNADSPDEAKDLLELKTKLLAAVDGSNKLSFIHPDRNVSLLLKAVRAHKDSKVLAAPQVLCLEDKTAEIKVMSNETYYIVDYTEPNNPSEKPQPILERVEESIALSLRPKLSENKNIDMQLESEISRFLDSEERKFKGKAPYKPPIVKRTAQSFRYIAENGQALLFGGHKIADRQDGQTEEKELLILITAHAIASPEQDKPAKTENLIVTEPPRTTTDVITQPTIAKSSTERPEDSEQEKTRPATERRRRPARSIDDSLAKIVDKQKTVQIFPLKHYDTSHMARIVNPLLSKTGHVNTDEKTNSLIVSDTAENMTRIAKIIAQFDVSKSDQIVTEIFEIRNGDPVEIVEILKKLINGRPEDGAIIEQGKEPIVLIPQPTYNWVIAKASPENLNQIGQWIKKLDIKKSTIGLDPIDEAVHEQLETIVDLSDLAPGMSFGEVVEKLENSVDPPLQIQPIWKDLLENAEVEQATPAGMDPLSYIKLRKALEILLASVTTSQLGESAKPTYIVDDGVIVIGTKGMLPQKLWIEKLDTPKSTIGIDPIDAAVHEQIEKIVDLSELNPGTSFGEVIEILKNSVVPPLQIQPIWKDLLENAEVEQATPAGMDPLSYIKLRKALEILLASVTTSQLGESAKPTYIVDQGVIVIGTKGMLPPKMGHRVTDIPYLIETADDTAQPSLREQKKTTPAIKPGELQILRQQYINNDLKVKYLFERVTKVENELIELRQKFTQSHPDVRKKAALLRAWKNALLERKKEVGKSFDDIMTKEIHQTNRETINKLLDELRKNQEHQQPLQQAQEQIYKLLDESEEPMTPLEQIQKQLDELLIKQQEALQVTEPNLPPAPKVKFISNTFIDTPLLDALKYIAEAANVTIIPDETIKGIVSCTLKDVTVEAALDIVLGGTPYLWKKTPYYYLVTSAVGPSELTARMESAKKLSNLGKALLIYANDHNDKYPNSLFTFSEYMKWQDFSWIRQNIEYLASGKTPADPPDTVIAYDKKLLEKGKGTNILYNDCHVGFVKAQELKNLGISESEIMIETIFLSVSEDFLKEVGLDADLENFSDDWRGHLAATYPTGQNGKPYGLMIDDLHTSFLLKNVQTNHDSKALVAPRVLCREGTTAEMGFLTEEYRYITGYNEPDSPSGEPQPKRDKVEIGTRIWLTPKLSGKNVDLDLKLEITQLKGIIEGKYKGKYPYQKPIIDVISQKMPCTIPDGKSMLIGGLKINEHVTIKQGIPGLKDLPLIGGAFRSKDETKDQKMLLILVKPITNPRQKAANVLPGREDSEEHIRRLAEQLEKKLKRPAN